MNTIHFYFGNSTNYLMSTLIMEESKKSLEKCVGDKVHVEKHILSKSIKSSFFGSFKINLPSLKKYLSICETKSYEEFIFEIEKRLNWIREGKV